MAGFFDSLQNNPESSEEDFLREQLVGSAPQYDPEGGWTTAKNLGKMAVEMTPPGALASAAGYMGDPSLFQNIGSGDYGTAALQAAGLIPGIGWVGKAGKLGKAVRAAEGVAPSAMREVGATPRGWDVAGPRRAAPMIEGSVSETDPFFGIRRTDRTRSWEGPKTKWPESRLNSYDDPYTFGLEENAFRVAPKTATSRSYPSYGSLWDKITDLPAATQADIHSLRQGGLSLSKFRMNAINSALKKRGLTLEELLASDPIVTGMAEGAKYEPPPMVRRFWDKNTGIYPEQNKELLKKALAVSAGAGLGAEAVGLMNGEKVPSGISVTPDVEPMNFTEFPMTSGPMGTGFESPVNTATEKNEPPVPVAAQNRPAAGGEKRAAPARKATAPVRRPAPKRTAPVRPARSSQRYYGDWRDTEPFSSDPIGGFIDELTGRTKQSTRKGSLGDLGYEKGGSVRRPFAGGGTEDRIPVLSDIGDALGGLFQPSEGGEQVVASDRAPMSSAKNFFEDWSTNPLSQFLFSAGLGTMASDRVNPLQAIGEGGLRGLEYMQAVSANQQAMRKEREAAAERRKELDYLQKVSGGSKEAPEEAPAKTSTVEPEISAPTERPVKVAGAEPATTGPTVATPTNETAPVEARLSSPVVARDNELKDLLSTEGKLTRGLGFMRDPQARQQANAMLQSLRSKINRIESEKREARLAEQAARTSDIQEKRLQKEIQISSPEYRRQIEAEKAQSDVMEKESAERRKQAIDAESKISNLEEMKEGLISGKITTGFGAESGLAFKKAAQPLGLFDEKSIAATEKFKTSAGRLVMDAANGSLGVGVSSTDRDYLASLQPGLATSKEGNIEIIDAAIRVEKRKQKIAEMEQEYRANHNGLLDTGFDYELAKWAKENPIRLEGGKEQSKTSAHKFEEGKIYPRGGKNYEFKGGKFYEVRQ